MYRFEDCGSATAGEGYGHHIQAFSATMQPYARSGAVVLSTDPKPRLRWTTDLHDRFVDAISQLGGADKATPKSIMRIMNVNGLTLYHLKSHLQKYRVGKHPHRNAATEAVKPGEFEASSSLEVTPTPSVISSQDMLSDTVHVNDALAFQIKVQKKLHEQLEVQKLLQLRIEAQGRYLQSILEKAQQNLSGQTAANIELEAGRAELSDSASKDSSDCFSLEATLPVGADRGMDHQAFESLECSPDSCLTSITCSERFEVVASSAHSQSGGNKRLKVHEHDAQLGQDGEGYVKPSSALKSRSVPCLEIRPSSDSCAGSQSRTECSIQARHLSGFQAYDGIHEDAEVKDVQQAYIPFHFIGRPEPRRAALSLEQVMSVASSQEKEELGSQGAFWMLAPESVGKGFDLNANNDSTGF